jgi:hypothetical protein
MVQKGIFESTPLVPGTSAIFLWAMFINSLDLKSLRVVQPYAGVQQQADER